MLLKKIYKLFKILKNSDYIKTLLRHGVAAGVEHIGLLEQLKPFGFHMIVDIGANRGQFSLVAEKTFPNAEIIAFEPLKEATVVYRRIFSTHPHIHLYEIAIGPEEKEMPIHVSQADDSSSLLPITSLQNILFPGTAEKEVRPIQVKPLVSVFRHEEIISPAFLKMDVQGFEKEALTGCQPLLDSFLYIYVECSFVELYTGQALAFEMITWLNQAGFNLDGVYNLTYDKSGRAVQGDFLFKRKTVG